MALLTCCMIVKNEAKTISKTLSSCVGIVDNFIILDTDSDDDTVNVIRNTCDQLQIPVIIYHHQFGDFSTTRNLLLRLARITASCGRYIMMLDANDEFRFVSGRTFRPLENSLRFELLDNDKDLYLLRFIFVQKSINKTYTSVKRAIFKKDKNFYYKYPVHEELQCATDHAECDLTLHDFEIYHDREQDKSSATRFERDASALRNYYKNNPSDISILFKLGQTYYNLKQYQESLEFFDMRSNYSNGHNVYSNENEYYKKENFDPECFLSYVFCFKILLMFFIEDKTLITDFITNFIKYASNFESVSPLSTNDFVKYGRCEPFFYAAIYYFKIKDYQNALKYIKEACSYEKPELSNSTLLIEHNIYDTDRWELLKHLHTIYPSSFGELQNLV